MAKYKLKRFSYAEKSFGTSSKLLGIFAPGAYQAKEAAKYAYDEDEYKKKRLGYALKGALTPGTATYVKYTAEKMAKDGKSKDEIREYLEDTNSKILPGLGEMAFVGGGGITMLAAHGKGLMDKLDNNRAVPSKKSDKESAEKKYSKMSYADEDYIKDRENERESLKYIGPMSGILGGVVGSSLGTVAGAALGGAIGKGESGKSEWIGAGLGTLAGGALGATAGYKLGKKHADSKNKEIDEKLSRYNKGNEEDRKYLRDREIEELRRREHREAISAMMAPKTVVVS